MAGRTYGFGRDRKRGEMLGPHKLVFPWCDEAELLFRLDGRHFDSQNSASLQICVPRSSALPVSIGKHSKHN